MSDTPKRQVPGNFSVPKFPEDLRFPVQHLPISKFPSIMDDPKFLAELQEGARKRGEAVDSAILSAEIAKANLASEFFKALNQRIKEFDDTLNQDEEVGMRLVSFGQAITFHVERLSWHNPSLILFLGVTAEGQKVTLMQHVTQISFLLIAMKKPNPDEPRRKFGFAHYEEKPPEDKRVEK